MERKSCPFCGEEIASTAKKCRFCGEWLEGAKPQEEISYKEPVMPVEVLEVNTTSGGNNYPAVNPSNTPVQITDSPVQPTPMSTVQPGQTIQSVGGQPIVVNVVNNQSVEQNVEQTQTVIVESSGSSDSAPGWIFTEMWCIAAGLGLALKSWWWFIGIGLIGSVLLMIPFIGAVMCVVIGLGWGLLGGAIGAAFFSTSAAWVIGIIVAVIAIYAHLEARKANMEEERK